MLKRKSEDRIILCRSFLPGIECQPPFAMKPGTPVAITELSLLLV